MKNEKGLAKFIDVCAKGLGKVYEPIHLVRMAKAEAKSMKLLAETARITSDVPMKINFEDTAFSTELETKEVQELCERAMGRDLYFKMVKQRNIESVIGKAYVELEDEKIISEEPIEQDWILRFFSYAEEVSDEDIQTLWAKILAGEIKKPKSYSLRTLETLRNLSKDEALLFNKIVPCIMGKNARCVLYSNLDVLKKYDIIYEDILKLADCGLISIAMSRINATFTKEGPFLYNTEHLIMVEPLKCEEVFVDLGIYALTSAGAELYNTIRHSESCRIQYVVDVANSIYQTCKGRARIKINLIKEEEGNKIYCHAIPYKIIENEEEKNSK